MDVPENIASSTDKFKNRNYSVLFTLCSLGTKQYMSKKFTTVN
jgi:hypothetical protein